MDSHEIGDREKMERAARWSQERLTGILMSAMDAVISVDGEQRLILYNPAAERMFGWSAAEVIGQPLDLLIPMRFRRAHREHIRAFGETRVTTRTMGKLGDLSGLRKDGTEFPVEASISQIEIEGEKIYTVILRDITERQAAEEAVRASEKRFRALVENSAEAIALSDADGTILSASPAAGRMLDIQAEAMIGRSTFDGLHPDDLERAKELFAQLLANPGTSASSQFRIRRKDGSWAWVEGIGTNLLQDPSVGAMVANYRDITERKQAEERTQGYLSRLAALHNVDLAIGASTDLRLTLNVLLEHVIDELHVDAANILLLDPHTRMLEYSAGVGFRTKALERVRLRLGEGHAGRVALEQRVIGIPDLAKSESSFGRASLLAVEGFVAYYGAPLIAKGQNKGVLEVFHRAPLNPDREWLDFFEALAGQAAIAIDSAQLFDNLQRSNSEMSLAYDLTIEGWSHALDLRDKETEGHTQRVTEITMRLAREFGIPEAELVHIRRGGLLHDIGKMGVPDRILLKPGPLTEDEWTIMRKHPGLAFDLLSPIPFLRPALDIPYCHHEKWDGTGYPRGLKGEQIPLSARIFAAVDVWDALRSDRPYRKSWPEEKARQYVQSLSGMHFDPRVVEVFLKSSGQHLLE